MDFIILKVNGTDVSGYPHEDAVRIFLTAPEPIVVEVKRRITESGEEKISNSRLISVGCQTELSGLTWLEDNSSLDCLEQDIDLEEITLRKCNSNERLGLTVCYSSSSEADTCTEVYIRDIAPASVADRDGRLRQGDQILQVNGKDVSNKEETESLFAENRKAVTLLISRCYNRSEEYLDVDSVNTGLPENQSTAYENSLIEQLLQQQIESQNSVHIESASKISSKLIEDKFNLTNSLVRSKLDSINNEISELDDRMKNIQIVKFDKKKTPSRVSTSIESDTEHIYETIPESADSEFEPIYSCPYESNEQSMIEKWLKIQNDEWSSSHIINDTVSKDNKIQKNKCLQSNSSGEEHENSSSAYNTGGSCNSNPLTFELGCSKDSKHTDHYSSTLILCSGYDKEDLSKNIVQPLESCGTCKQSGLKKKLKLHSKTNEATSPCTQFHGTLSNPHLLSDTMYTNVANLQQTMLLQQQLFRQALVQNNTELVKPTTSFTAPSLSQYQSTNNDIQDYSTQLESVTHETKMEWKVKRRPDGTRYIARRPVRNKILKNRAIKISEERGGVTTEDDTISELKIGRYWTKEERKKHLEKSKERKQRQEILLASRNLEANCEIVIQKTMEKVNNFTSKKAANNLDNTVKKHKHKKYKEACENLATVQEILIHGPKAPNSNSKMVGLLSVTTV